ncbi:DMP19 family protein [Flavobacterium sp. MAHUQ-51]|uniref:DMP19 family protein n=1 Tax=Flavobacterium sp. GCM10022190 TaxID=3252639 RepID=UPI0036215448
MIRKVKYTLTDLQNSTDEKLVDLIYEKSAELELGTFGQSLEIADPAMAEFQAMWILKGEVQNGGYDQFFLNNGPEYGQIALAGLKRIGATEFANLTQKAIEIYKNQDLKFKDKRNPEFNALDDEFYDLDGLERLQVKYIRKNYEKFIVD